MEGDSAGRRRIAMKIKATVFLLAAACFFSSAIGRPSIQTQNYRPSLLRGRALLQENTFDVRILVILPLYPISLVLSFQPNAYPSYVSCVQVTVISNAQGGTTSSVTPLFTVNFGRAILQKNPLGVSIFPLDLNKCPPFLILFGY
jgi:hypothetical protein